MSRKIYDVSLKCFFSLLCFSIWLSTPCTAAQQLSPVWVLSTVAGTGTTGDTGDGGQQAGAKIAKPLGVAVDKAGNIYFSEGSSVIRKVAPNGIISTIAGTANKTGYSGDNGPAVNALLNSPIGVELDTDENLLIGDELNQVVRKINFTTGIITTVAGTGSVHGYTGDGGPATSATLYTPYTAASDAAGNIYIADYTNHVIRKVDTSGNISTFAGNGTSGYTGDGGPAIKAEFKGPFSVWFDPAGNMYINDVGASAIRLIDTGGVIHTIAGNGTTGYSGDGGAAISAELDTQHGVVIDGLGNTYIADETNDLMRMINPSGIISTIGGAYKVVTGATTGAGDGGPALAGKLDLPYGLAIDSSNNLYEPDAGGLRIRKMSFNTGLPTTAVGASATQKIFVESGVAVTPSTATLTPSTEFTLGALSGCSLGTQLAANTACTMPITFTPAAAGLQTSQLAITDASGNVSVIGLSGVGTAPEMTFGPASISTVAGNGTAGFSGPAGQASAAEVSSPRGGVVDSAGNIYFADSGNNVIRRIDAASGAVSTVAGTGTTGYSGDAAAATSAQLNVPAKVVVDAAGDLYIADTGNSVIRFVDASTGFISTIAGNGTAAYTGDAGAATAASLNHPQGLAVDLGSHVYVADTGNNVIRYFGKGGQISTFVGNGTAGYSGDGSNAHGAQLNVPEAVSLDQKGDVYIVDTGNSVVRMVSTTNQISTIAGTQGTNGNSGDGGLAVSASLANPSDIALDAAGDLYIAAGGQVRMINAAGTISTMAGTGASGAYSGEGGAAINAVIPAPASNLMLDSAANLYVSDTAGNLLLKVAAAMPRTVDLGTQTPNTTGSAQRISVLNVGNSALQFSAVTVSSPFVLQSGDSSACSSTTSLSPGQSCSLSVAFSPTITGTFTGSITLTDNALNAASGTQTINLTGKSASINNTSTSLVLSPISPIYGQTTQAVATATVSGGTGATGNVTFTLNGVSIGMVALTGTSASINLPPLQTGMVNLSASYAGDASNTSSSASTSITVQPAVLTVTVANATQYFGYAHSAFTYSIQGYVNGDTASVVSGAPVLSTTATQSSPLGPYPITATIGTLAAANYTFAFVPGTLTVQPPPPPDFTLTVSPASVVMENGGSATFTFSLTSVWGYMGTVKFACSSVPANIGCSFSPASLTGNPNAPNATTTSQLTILTGSVYARAFGSGYRSTFFAVPLLPLGCLLLRRRKRKYVTLFLALVSLVVMSGVSGCGGSDDSLPATGTNQVTVTATDSASNLSHSSTFSLTIE